MTPRAGKLFKRRRNTSPERIPNKPARAREGGRDIGGNGCAVRRSLTEKVFQPVVCLEDGASSYDIRGVREAVVSAVDFDPEEAGVDDHEDDRDLRCRRKRGNSVKRRRRRRRDRGRGRRGA